MVTPVHPGPAAAAIPASMVQGKLIDQARAEVPNEGLRAGIVRIDPRRAADTPRFEPTRNARPLRIATRSTPTTCTGSRSRPTTPMRSSGGIVHSHTHTPAVLSPTDIGLTFYPDALYILVSLSGR